MSTVPSDRVEAAVMPPNNSGSPDWLQMLLLANQYSNANSSAGSTRDAFSNASGIYTDRMQKTNDYTDTIASVLAKMYGDPMSSSWSTPSTTGGSKAYMDAARGGDPTPVLQNALGLSGNVVLQHLLQADDLTTRQVPIASFSTAGVANEAARKFRNLVPSVDRAAAIASSQGFADALKRGVANSTQAAGTADELTRKFSDVYSKLEQQANDSAMAENQANYKDYLAGVGQQVGQNQMLGTLANQLLGTTANVYTNTQAQYANSSAQAAARLLQALQLGDSAAVQSRQTGLAPLLQALVSLNGQGLNNAQTRYTTTANNATTAASNRGAQLTNLLANPMVQSGVNWIGNTAQKWWKDNMSSPQITGPEPIYTSDPNYTDEGDGDWFDWGNGGDQYLTV